MADLTDAILPPDRAPRAKKDTLKKREAKAGSLAPEGSGRGTPDPKSSSAKGKKIDNENELAPIRYKLPLPKETDFEAARGPDLVPHHTKVAPDGTEIQFYEDADQLLNKKHFHYVPAVADPAFPSIQYFRQTETEPFGARLNFQDIAAHMFLDATGHHVTTDEGYRSAKANVCAREGNWYYEVKITSGILALSNSKNKDGSAAKDNGHVRMGFARREANLDTPVGYDAYSYGLRDVKGQAIHMSRPKDFFPPGEDIREDDVIGLEINLPSESLHRKIVEGQYNPAVDLVDEGNKSIERRDRIRDRVPIRYKNRLFFEQIDYHPSKAAEELFHPAPVPSSSGGFGTSAQVEQPSPTHPNPSLRTLPHSCIKVYKNGKFMGVAWEGLLAFLPPASNPLPQVGAREGVDDGMLGYYPCVSVFGGGAVETKFGPDFWYPPPGMHGQDDDEVDMIGNDQPTSTLPTLPTLSDLRGIEDRFEEQIVEDILADCIDETCAWAEDGFKDDEDDGDGVAASGASAHQNVSGDVLGSEIKELVQEDD